MTGTQAVILGAPSSPRSPQSSKFPALLRCEVPKRVQVDSQPPAPYPAWKAYTSKFEFGQSVGIAQSIFEGLEKPNFKICGGDNALTRGSPPWRKP